MHWTRYLNKSLIIGVLFSLLSIGYFYGSFFIKRTRLSGQFGADLMPKIYAAVLLACSLIQLAVGIRAFLKDARQAGDPIQINRTGLIRVGIAFLAILSYILLLETIGFIPCSVALLFLLCCLMTPAGRKRRYVAYLIFSAVLPLLAFYLFREVMHMALPIGSVFGG